MSNNEEYKYGFRNEDVSTFKTGKGLNEAIVREISAAKHEPDWMTQFRLNAYRAFREMPLPDFRTGFRLLHVFYPAQRRGNRFVGQSPSDDQGNLSETGHSRSGTEVPRRRFHAIRKRGRLSQYASRGRRQGRDLFIDRYGVADLSGIVPEVFQ